MGNTLTRLYLVWVEASELSVSFHNDVRDEGLWWSQIEWELEALLAASGTATLAVDVDHSPAAMVGQCEP